MKMTNNKWTDEEINFLKFAYPNKDFTTKEIQLAFKDKSLRCIHSKASTLGIKRPFDKLPYGYKRCGKCKTIALKKDFASNKSRKDGLQDWCRNCQSQRNLKIKKAGVPTFTKKYCKVCKKEKPLSDFHKDANNKDGYRYQCKECTSIYDNKRRLKGERYDGYC